MPQSTCLNALSVDLEDWYQAITSLNARPDLWQTFEKRVVNNTRRLIALFEEYQVKATFFVLGCVAVDHPELVQEVAAAGHEIGLHGYSHRRIHHLTPIEFSKEIDRALGVINPLIRQPVIGHRAPYFSINQHTLWALDVLWEKGFRYDSSFFPTRNTLYGYPAAPRFPHRVNHGELIEFPLSTTRWGRINFPVAGGFYMRALPYWIIKNSITTLNRAGQPAIMYMHPWELDTPHRYNHVTLREWVVQYTGRRRMEAKLRQLLTDFKFAPFRVLLDQASI